MLSLKNDGSFTEHINAIRQKADKAYYGIVAKSKEWQGFNPKTFFHIFDHTILPILSYGAETWSGKEWSVIEKLHLMACKYILGVNQSTPTTGIYAELGRHPIQLQWKIAIIKYLKRLNDLSEDRLAKKAYRQLILDDENGHFSWFSVTNTVKQEHAVDVPDSVETIKSEIKSTFLVILRKI